MRVDTGSYTGDAGASGQVISGLTNCTSDLSSVDSFVMVMGAGTDAFWTTNTFASGYSREMWGNASAVNTHITALGTAQFTVDASLNTNGVVYYYLVLQYDGTTQDFETGSYTGNGLDNQTGLLTYGAWTPKAAIVGTSDGNEITIGRTTNGGIDLSQFFNVTAEAANYIQVINSGNCTIGSALDVNESGSTFHFVVIGDVSGYVDFIEYAGNSTDNRTVATADDFQPDFSFVMNPGQRVFAKEITTVGVDSSIRLESGGVASDRLQDLVATGIEVSSNVSMNSTGNDYYAWCFKQYAGESGSTLLPIIMNYNQKMRS